MAGAGAAAFVGYCVSVARYRQSYHPAQRCCHVGGTGQENGAGGASRYPVHAIVARRFSPRCGGVIGVACRHNQPVENGDLRVWPARRIAVYRIGRRTKGARSADRWRAVCSRAIRAICRIWRCIGALASGAVPGRNPRLAAPAPCGLLDGGHQLVKQSGIPRR